MLKSEFCQRCENLAIHFRHQMGLQGYDPLMAFDLASFRKTIVYEPADLLEGEALEKALELKKWFAIAVPDTPPIIIIHPLQSDLEREISMMHELAHLILGHKPEKLVAISEKFASRDYPKQAELEADYLAECLKFPKLAAAYVQQQSLTVEEICDLYQLSQTIASKRLKNSP